MDSKRSIAARANGAESKGPKTEQGKAKSSQNALKHGFTADKWVHLPGDEAGAFEQYAEGLLTVLKPADPLQEALAERIISCMWRLRRVIAMEAHLVHDDKGKHSTGLNFTRYDWPHAHLAIARYESHLDRSLYKALKELRALQSEATALADQPPMPNTQHPIPSAPSRLAPNASCPEEEELQNEPNTVPYDIEDITRRVLEKRREIQANAPAQHPREGRKTTAEALNAFRAPKNRHSLKPTGATSDKR